MKRQPMKTIPARTKYWATTATAIACSMWTKTVFATSGKSRVARTKQLATTKRLRPMRVIAIIRRQIMTAMRTASTTRTAMAYATNWRVQDVWIPMRAIMMPRRPIMTALAPMPQPVMIVRVSAWRIQMVTRYAMRMKWRAARMGMR